VEQLEGEHFEPPEVRMTQKVSLDATAREQLDAARGSSAQRAATTLVGGHEYVMRQTLIALLAGATMDEHENPGEATVYVVNGRIRVRADGDSWEAGMGELLELPPARHSVEALEDSAMLLTAVPIPRQ
jgi:quercetin dioxygenase-like cupin family protein